MPRLCPPAWVRAIVVLLFLSACSENFGTPPDPNAPRVGVVESGFAGPLEALRAPRMLRGNAGLLYLTMDQRGSYRLTPQSEHWRPGPDLLGSRQTRHLACDGEARLWAATDGVNLLVSRDGGELFETIDSPSNTTLVEFLGVLPPSESHAEGAWLAVVGVAAHLRAIGASSWTPITLPSVPMSYISFDADAAGRALLGVELDSGWAVWQSVDGARSFQPVDALDDRPLAVAQFGGGRRAVIHTGGLLVDGVIQSGLPSDGFEHAALRGDATGFDLLAFRGAELWWGRGPSALWNPLTPSMGVRGEAGLVASSGGGFAVADDRSVLQLDRGVIREIPFGGAHLDMGALVADPREPGSIYLAGGPRGEIWSGPAEGPWQSLGIAGQPTVSALLPDPLVAGGLFSSGFGVQYRAAGSGSWEDRNDGQSSYLCDLFFGGPVVVHTLAARPEPQRELWLGAINGDGPYRSRDGGRSWRPIQDGLGPLGTCLEGSGLQGISQARAFVFPGEKVLMGGFKGGVWELDENLLRWSQRNEGLPDVFGDEVDSCCFDPLAAAVDLRQLVALDDGTLLAATGWGVYRLEAGARRWVESNSGLSNFDVYHLVPLPGDSGFVLAGCSGKLDAPRWLFLSRDAGRSWDTVDTGLLARRVKHLEWSDPARLEAVAVLDWSGAWRLRLDP